MALLQKRLSFGNHTTFIVVDTYVSEGCIRSHWQHITAWSSIADVFHHSGNQRVCFGRTSIIFTCETAIFIKLYSLFFSNGLVRGNVRPDLAELNMELDILPIYPILFIADGFRKLTCIVVTEFTHWWTHWFIQSHFIVQRWKRALSSAFSRNILARDL